MATHPSVLAWRIPGAGSLVGCRLWGRTESGTTEATQQQQRQVCPSFPSKDQLSFNFMVTVTICSDLGAQEDKNHCFHFFPVYLP